MKKLRIRITALVMALVVFCGLFLFRLTDYQIVNGNEYKAQATQGYTRTVTLKAPRGEILDRNGEPLVSNRVGFNIQLDKVYLDAGKQNDVILSLINLMEQEGHDYNDSLPMAKKSPYTFDAVQSSAVDKLKTDLRLNLYATEENVMEAIIKKYRKTPSNTLESTRWRLLTASMKSTILLRISWELCPLSLKMNIFLRMMRTLRTTASTPI